MKTCDLHLTNDLRGIVDPGQSLVGGHHGHEVGEGAEAVVQTLGGVLLLGREYEGHDEGVDIVDSTLEEDKGRDSCESLLLSLIHEFPSSAGKEQKSEIIPNCPGLTSSPG